MSEENNKPEVVTVELEEESKVAENLAKNPMRMRLAELSNFIMDHQAHFSINVPLYDLILAERVCGLALDRVKEETSRLILMFQNEIHRKDEKLRELGVDPDTI